MSFIEFLQGIGDRLGILETGGVSSSENAVRVQTRTVTLQELASEIKSEEIRALADTPSELALPFDKIFEAAGISPGPEEWTVEKLKRLIASEPFNKLPHKEIQTRVLELLNSEGVSAEVIVKDAMARDRALDSFEARVLEKMRERTEACSRRRREIELEMKNLQEERVKLEEQMRRDEEKWLEWRKHKRAHERELASVASYIVDHPVITTEDEAP